MVQKTTGDPKLVLQNWATLHFQDGEIWGVNSTCRVRRRHSSVVSYSWQVGAWPSLRWDSAALPSMHRALTRAFMRVW